MPAYRNVDRSRLSAPSAPIPPVDTEGSTPDCQLPPSPYQNIKIEYPNGPDSLIPFSPSSSCSPPFSPPVNASSRQGKPHRSRARNDDPNHVSRPRNAFIVFRSYYVQRRLADSQQDHQNELSKSAAKVWNRMSVQERSPFANEALREKEEHYRLHPNYAYAPKSNVMKSRKTQKKPARKPMAMPSVPRALVSETAFVPTADIPPLELPPRQEEILYSQCDENQIDQNPDFAVDPAPFHPHIDSLPVQFGFRQYDNDTSDSTMPAYIGETMNDLYDFPTFEPSTPTLLSDSYGSSLLCEDAYRSLDFLAALQGPSGPSGPSDSDITTDTIPTYDLSFDQSDDFVDPSAFVNLDWSFPGTQA